MQACFKRAENQNNNFGRHKNIYNKTNATTTPIAQMMMMCEREEKKHQGEAGNVMGEGKRKKKRGNRVTNKMK